MNLGGESLPSPTDPETTHVVLTDRVFARTPSEKRARNGWLEESEKSPESGRALLVSAECFDLDVVVGNPQAPE
jgi:hypothetical protein